LATLKRFERLIAEKVVASRVNQQQTAEVRYDLELARWFDLNAYIDYHGAIAAAKGAVRSGDSEVAAPFTIQARTFLEGSIRNSLERLERFEELVGAAKHNGMDGVKEPMPILPRKVASKTPANVYKTYVDS